MAGHGSGARRIAKAVAALALAATALAGCGSDGGGSDATSTSADAQAHAQTQTHAQPQPSGASPRDPPRAVVERYLAALRDGDDDAACDTMSRRLLANVASGGGSESCEDGLDAVREAAESDDRIAFALRAVQNARVRSVDVRGDVATARYASEVAGAELEGVMRLVREDGRWVLDTAATAEPDRVRRAALDDPGDATAAGSGCPIDAAAASAAFRTRVEALPTAQAGCRFGRPGAGDDGEDPQQPSVRIGPFPYGDLAATKARLESGLDPGQRMLDRSRWGRDAFMVTDTRGDDVTATAIVPAAGAAVVAVISFPGAKDDLDRVADELVAAIRRG